PFERSFERLVGYIYIIIHSLSLHFSFTLSLLLTESFPLQTEFSPRLARRIRHDSSPFLSSCCC
ncbi:hypothetical protein GIB67_025914, partial [Kingdonia uniflora]